MVSRDTVEDQLRTIGFNFRAWGRSEVNELYQILMADEEIKECVNGEYGGGFALLLATNHRVLLIDRKPFLYLSVEDLRFDSISDFYFHNKLIFAQVTISTTGKTLHFQSWNKRRLRNLLTCVQERVIQLRHNQHLAQQFEAMAAQFQALPPASQPLTDAPPAAMYRTDVPAPAYAPNTAPNYQPFSQSGGQAGGPSFSRGVRLATYTRGKMPSFRHYHEAPPAETGQVYPYGYQAGQAPLEY